MNAPELSAEETEDQTSDAPPEGEENLSTSGAETKGGSGDKREPDEPEVIEVELTEDDFGGDLFTGVEDAEDDEESESSSMPPGSKADEALGLTDDHSNIEAAINEGAARLAVVGLGNDHKLDNDEDVTDSDCLEAEFHDVFSAFRLGYFGAGFLDEYIFTENDDIDPAWGLLGAMLCAAAFTVWMRPDGDEIVLDAKDALLGGTA